MQMKKRFMVTLLAVALVIAALTIPASALNSTMLYKRDNGTITAPNGIIYNWDCSTGASITQATGTITITPLGSLNLIGDLTASLIVGNEIHWKNDSTTSVGASLSLSISNIYNGQAGEIQGARGIYKISGSVTRTLTVGIFN